MYYFEMIKNENTDGMYDLWKEYRQDLTAYILEGLVENIKDNDWIAIWGAGGCNDIDIKQLAKKYKLLLIDRDVEKLVQLRASLGLSSDSCKVADVGFWDIGHEDYEMFEALLMDKASEKDFEIYFKELMKRQDMSVNLENYSVSCSIVVGLASQLNARFGALLYLYKDGLSEELVSSILSQLEMMNSVAVERLFVAIRQITRKMIISGYEVLGCYKLEEAIYVMDNINQSFYIGKDKGKYLCGNEDVHITVAGNQYWHKLIYKGILMDKFEEIGRCQMLLWEFSQDKYYPMLMVSLLCVNK